MSVPTTFIQCYAPTEANTAEAKESFYKAFGKVMKEVHRRDYLVVMGDFNARVGNDWKNWPGIVGRHGFGDEAHDPRKNDNWDFFSERGLSVTGTFFPHKNIHKYTWYQRGTDFSQSQIDHIMVRKTWLSAVHDTRVYRGAEFSNWLP
jgi:exonuclease III